MSLIMSFCNRLPEMFRIATPQVKREIIQTCIRTLTYDGETLKIQLFPVFEKLKYWKNVKNGAANGMISEPTLELIKTLNDEFCQAILFKIEKFAA